MKVILREDVQKLGKSGDIVTVKEGFGRNFLLPRKMAVLANEKNVRQMQHDQGVISARRAKMKDQANAQSQQLSAVALSSSARSESRRSCTARSPRWTSPRRAPRKATASIGGRSTCPSRSNRSERTRSRCACTTKSPPSFESKSYPSSRGSSFNPRL